MQFICLLGLLQHIAPLAVEQRVSAEQTRLHQTVKNGLQSQRGARVIAVEPPAPSDYEGDLYAPHRAIYGPLAQGVKGNCPSPVLPLLPEFCDGSPMQSLIVTQLIAVPGDGQLDHPATLGFAFKQFLQFTAPHSFVIVTQGVV